LDGEVRCRLLDREAVPRLVRPVYDEERVDAPRLVRFTALQGILDRLKRWS
jgi:hypothetical protein